MNSEFTGCTLEFFRNGEIIKLDGRMCAYDGGFEIAYLTEKDRCSLIYNGETLVQSRRGEVDLDMTFSLKEQSALVFGEGGAFGKLKIITKALNVVTDGNKKIITLNYVLGEGGEDVNLKITVCKDKEKK